MTEQSLSAGPTVADAQIPATPLGAHAVSLLRHAAAVSLSEERNVWRPDSWLIHRCWQTLARSGAAQAAVDTANLVADRDPLALAKAVHQLAVNHAVQPGLHDTIGRATAQRRRRLFAANAQTTDANSVNAQELLLLAATQAHLGDGPAMFAYLERLDQLAGAWDLVFNDGERRALLASALARGGHHPLTNALIGASVRRYDEAGADLLQRLTAQLDTEKADDAALIERCAAALRYASLTTMHAQRVAVAVLARAGHGDEVLKRLVTLANIQEARRESGLALRRNDQQLLRQVKRPQANPDIDFQVYTLQEAIRVMPVHRISREARAELARQLAMLGMRSDGWTAAGAAATLVELGALKLAIEVVDNIEPTDPTRSEGAIALVRELLAVDEVALAAEQAQKALSWIQQIQSENAERATIWGLVDAYLDHQRPQDALRILDQRIDQPSFGQRLRARFRPTMTDDGLRDSRLRLRAYLQQQRSRNEIMALVRDLQTWSPKLLEGDALVAFTTDGLLSPLLEAGLAADAWSLLPDLAVALRQSAGDRHAARLAQIAGLLTSERALFHDEGRPQIEQFLFAVWEADSRKGIWQAVHGIEGSLPLIIDLAGPDAVIEIAQLAATEGEAWLPTAVV